EENRDSKERPLDVFHYFRRWEPITSFMTLISSKSKASSLGNMLLLAGILFITLNLRPRRRWRRSSCK
ncbi:hypothetical protein LCGC14_2360020, partial [marine sediment metagenome]